MLFRQKEGVSQRGMNSFKEFSDDYINQTKNIKKGFKHMIYGPD